MEKGEKGGMSGKGVWAHLFRKQGMGFRKGGCLFFERGWVIEQGWVVEREGSVERVVVLNSCKWWRWWWMGSGYRITTGGGVGHCLGMGAC